MNITRTKTYKIDTNEFKEGDQISVGKYTATCVKVYGESCIFLLDQYLDKTFMHKNLIHELNEHLLKDENFKEINAIAKPYIYCDGPAVLYRVPFAGEMFSGTEKDAWIKKYCAQDTPDGFLNIWECMKNPRNRVAFGGGKDYASGWLMNPMKDSARYFAYAGGGGSSARYTRAFLGVRPVFVIENKPQKITYEINEDDTAYVLNRVQDALDDTQYGVFGYDIAKGIFLNVLVSKK